ncbi:hypothetical protein B7P43_G16479 [Cryptotermes secundus]|uniref:Uncharacterized protein n=1 Tax=Cryptotermes secundus TaxID=105785 RepID=A0A2J7PGX0_9NEOP|nr:hypothetical protein B7P43_G16479 [Cryptotermes secundus]
MGVSLLHGKAWASLMHDRLIEPFFFLEKTDKTIVLGHAGALWHCPSYHLKLSSNNVGCFHICATMLGNHPDGDGWEMDR